MPPKKDLTAIKWLDREFPKTSKNIQTDVPQDLPERDELKDARCELSEWITKMERGLYVDPEACNTSISQVHVMQRQLHVVVGKLSKRCEDLNGEIKLLNKMRKDLTFTLDELDKSLCFHHPVALVSRPGFSKDVMKEQELLLHERTGRLHLCQERQLEALRILKNQFIKVRQQQLDLGRLREKVIQEIKNLSKVQSNLPFHRTRIHQMKVKEELHQRKVDWLNKVDRREKGGVLPHPIPKPAKDRGIHFNSHLPIHQRWDKHKELYPFAFEERCNKGPRVFALNTRDTFKTMTMTAGACMCAIDRACKETILLRQRIYDAVNAAFEVEHRRKRQHIKIGRLAVGKEYGVAIKGCRPKEEVQKIYYPPGQYHPRSQPLRQLV